VRLALFDAPGGAAYRLGVVGDGTVVDVTAALSALGHTDGPADRDPLTAGWWRALCRDLAAGDGVLRPALEKAATAGAPVPLDRVRLRAPVLNPSKIIACASNYGAHVEEMHKVQQRTLGRVEPWMMDFDVFLKAPSAISGPAEPIRLPRAVVGAGQEIHHESELVVVIGRGGHDIPEDDALRHVAGYAIGLDITVRGEGDRSRRKSYDTFAPIGPWLTTADEVPDPGALEIDLWLNGDDHRQHVRTADMITGVPAIVAYASAMMTLLPGDVLFTGAPPGVGPIAPGDVLDTRISGLGAMTVPVEPA
jgi:2-keto-4-pentenoate hydratase/2-oxohepta-3-ene-1,7-dioic acid hydratase in catechol pathway